MAYKFNKLKSIKKGLIGPNILFPAAYLLFSAEICTGRGTNNPGHPMQQVLRASLRVNPVDPLDMKKDLEKAEGNALAADESVDPSDKVVEGLEGSEDDTEELKAANPDDASDKVAEDLKGSEGNALAADESVNPSDKIAESLEGSEGNSLAADESVDPSDKIAENLEGSEGKTEGLASTQSVDQPKVHPKSVNMSPLSAPAGAVPPPPPPIPGSGAVPPMQGSEVPEPLSPRPKLVPASSNQNTAQQSKEPVQQNINNNTAENNLVGQENMTIFRTLMKEPSCTEYQECMDAILEKSPSCSSLNLRCNVIKKVLKPLKEHPYLYSKREQVIEWVLRNSDKNITQQYDNSTLNLVIKEVKENQEKYQRFVSLVQNLNP